MADYAPILDQDTMAAEQSVIGALLLAPDCINAVLAELSPEDLLDPTCRNTYEAIRRLSAAGRPVDLVLIQEAVDGGDAWIKWATAAVEITPTSANVMEYVRIVRDAAQLRRMRHAAEDLLECRTLSDAMAAAQALASSAAVQETRGCSSGADLAALFWKRLNAPKPDYIPWGIPTADKKVRSELGDMILLGGYPSTGKTLLSLQMAVQQAQAGYRVGFYSLETQDFKLADRIMSMLSHVPLKKIKDRDLSEADYAALAQASSALSELSISAIEAQNWTAAQITSHAIARKYQIIYVDYLQLVAGPEQRTYDRVSAVSRTFKLFAPSHRITVVALAQLTRPDKITKKDGSQLLVPPTMQSFKESGQIEQDADAAFLLWESIPDDYTSPRRFKLGKNKEGERFTVTLEFDGAHQRMVEEAEDPSREVARKYTDAGKAAKAVRRANTASGQMTISELPNEPTPFEN